MAYMTIPGFQKMSKQRIFNMAVALISKTRVKSINRGSCVYSGTGCNAAPLIQERYRSNADTMGAWGELIKNEQVPTNNEQFIIELQKAHDSSGEIFFMTHWKTNMQELAKRWNLSTSTLDKVTE